MEANKNIEKIVAVLMAAAVLLCFLAISNAGRLTELLGGTGVRMEYESRLFDTSEPISVNILMDEKDWNAMLSNATSEEYYVCDVVVNGRKFNDVAIRPKGNTSLSAIAMDTETDRFSLKLEFDHFVKGQKCFGLDKLILNNNYADATNMKEAIIYDMYQYLGATASLYNYAKVSVNGDYWGLYLALEAVEDSFMLRNFGTEDGELYKPDSMEMGGGKDSKSDGGSSMPSMSFPSDFGDMTPPSGMDSFPSGNFSFSNDSSENSGKEPPSFPGGSEFPSGEKPSGTGKDTADSGSQNMPEGSDSETKPENGPGTRPDGGADFNPAGFGGFSMGGGGANLNYTDDDLDSYSTIWDGEVTKTGKKDHRRVVTALKNISESNDLETYLNVDNILKYMAVHTFSVNMDSLSGSMAHNYYLYENDGQLDIFPWDYNLSLGGMSMGSDGNATEMVNDPIDTPFSGTKFFDSLLNNEQYREQYHAYLRELVDEYVNGGKFDETYNSIRSQIDSLVETDPTAFYPYDEYCTAADILYETVKLRASSIDGQLNGTIPSTDAGQRKDSSSRIDASHIDVKAMGQFNMGGEDGKFRGGRSERKNKRPGSEEESTEENNPGGFDPGSFSMNGESRPDMESFTPPSSSESSSEDSKIGEPSSENPDGTPSFGPGGSMPSSFSGMPGQGSMNKTNNLVTYGICFGIMLIACLAAFLFKRRR